MIKITLEKIIDVINNINNKKGATAKQIINYLRRSDQYKRDLVCAVRRLLKKGLNEGKLKHRAGFYKQCIRLSRKQSNKVNKKYEQFS